MPMTNPPHPGELIAEDILAPLGLSVTAAAQALGVGRQALSAVLNGRSSVSPDMALRLEKAFGSNAEMLLRMQLAYDVAQMRKRAHTIRVKRVRRAA